MNDLAARLERASETWAKELLEREEDLESRDTPVSLSESLYEKALLQEGIGSPLVRVLCQKVLPTAAALAKKLQLADEVKERQASTCVSYTGFELLGERPPSPPNRTCPFASYSRAPVPLSPPTPPPQLFATGKWGNSNSGISLPTTAALQSHHLSALSISSSAEAGQDTADASLPPLSANDCPAHPDPSSAKTTNTSHTCQTRHSVDWPPAGRPLDLPYPGSNPRFRHSHAGEREGKPSNSSSNVSLVSSAADSEVSEPVFDSAFSARLYDRIGGWDLLAASVQLMYQRLQADPETTMYFTRDDIAKLHRHMGHSALKLSLDFLLKINPLQKLGMDPRCLAAACKHRAAVLHTPHLTSAVGGSALAELLPGLPGAILSSMEHSSTVVPDPRPCRRKTDLHTEPPVAYTPEDDARGRIVSATASRAGGCAATGPALLGVGSHYCSQRPVPEHASKQWFGSMVAALGT
ncbi:hypothetical protein HaLaN_14635 [Haematococcus lacustris]|uniref:Uncharacterized protein n=1 Tax=Haematococcus lacustris TaxID=44745 RepID=A0A699Z712_HAELA|nr:hypothetical protein HaLaN_14635 [Haematococcus lacustris]